MVVASVQQIIHIYNTAVYKENGTFGNSSDFLGNLSATSSSNVVSTIPPNVDIGAVQTLVAYGGGLSVVPSTNYPNTFCNVSGLPTNQSVAGLPSCGSSVTIFAGQLLTYRVQFNSPWTSLAVPLQLNLFPPFPWAPVQPGLSIDFAQQSK